MGSLRSTQHYPHKGHPAPKPDWMRMIYRRLKRDQKQMTVAQDYKSLLSCLSGKTNSPILKKKDSSYGNQELRLLSNKLIESGRIVMSSAAKRAASSSVAWPGYLCHSKATRDFTGPCRNFVKEDKLSLRRSIGRYDTNTVC